MDEGNTLFGADPAAVSVAPVPATKAPSKGRAASKATAASKAVGARKKARAGSYKALSLHDQKKAAVEARQAAQAKGTNKKKKADAAPVKRSRFCFGVRAFRDVHRAMHAPFTFLVQAAPMQRLIDETVQDTLDKMGIEDRYNVTGDARRVLHELAEQFVRTRLAQVNMMANHARRQTIMKRDFQFFERVMDNGVDGFTNLNCMGDDARKVRARAVADHVEGRAVAAK